MSKHNNYYFYNFPKFYSLKDYNEVTNYIVGKYSVIKNLISIYNWGDPSTPGISDIDIVLVLKENASALAHSG